MCIRHDKEFRETGKTPKVGRKSREEDSDSEPDDDDHDDGTETDTPYSNRGKKGSNVYNRPLCSVEGCPNVSQVSMEANGYFISHQLTYFRSSCEECAVVTLKKTRNLANRHPR